MQEEIEPNIDFVKGHKTAYIRPFLLSLELMTQNTRRTIYTENILLNCNSKINSVNQSYREYSGAKLNKNTLQSKHC
jgi:hypothetical protein